MPRIREVKPEIFLDEQLAEVSHAARFLFVGLWTLADREGRLEDRPARIKAQIFPYGSEDCDALLDELANHAGAFVQRYEVDGRRLLAVRSFKKHQRPHPKETPSKIPPPPAVESREVSRQGSPTPTCQVDPSGGSMGTWVHGHMGSGEVGAPPLPPAPEQRAEDETRRTITHLQLALAGKLAALSEHPNSRQSLTAWCREVSSYERADGTKVKGVADYRTITSIDRLERSISDADWWLEELEAGKVVGAPALVEAARGTR